MTTRTAERVDDWESRPFDEGFEALRDLAERSFSGVVTAGSATCCFLNGIVVGILDGTVKEFEDAAGTVYTAPSPALPLLVVMQERREEPRARYYSEETPLSEADDKLSEGGFTGYVELSENVLSGDYYVVYHKGESMSVAFVGQSDQLLTGDEAFQRADDEVGIYEVFPVEIEPVEIPDPDPEPAGSDGDGTATGDGESSNVTAGGGSNETTRDSATEAARWAEEIDTEPTGGESGPAASADREESEERQASSGRRPADSGSDSSAATEPSSGAEREDQRADADGSRAAASTGRTDEPLAAESATEAESTPVEEPAELERRTIPSLDPGRTRTAGGVASGSGSRSDQRARAGGTDGGGRSLDRSSRDALGRDAPGRSRGREPESGEELREREAEIEDLEAEVERLEAQREDLTTEVSQLEAERDELAAGREELAADLGEVREERDRLREEVDRLRRRVAELESEEEQAAEADIKLTPADAIDQTDLRVRYDSKGEATLEAAHAGEADREAVAENLTLGYHTLFDDSNAVVEGEPFRSFLEGTLQYLFVEWLVYDLLYEIQETGNEGALRDLYDAIPRIHDVQLDVGIRVSDEESAVFDMAFYDVDGNLLAVANVNDNRSKVGETIVSELLTAASRVRESHSAMVGAFLVTASVFNADARKIPKEESGGGLLRRDSRESYISVSRSSGFHLCLVEEDDEENFHLDVPEL